MAEGFYLQTPSNRVVLDSTESAIVISERNSQLYFCAQGNNIPFWDANNSPDLLCACALSSGWVSYSYLEVVNPNTAFYDNRYSSSIAYNPSPTAGWNYFFAYDTNSTSTSNYGLQIYDGSNPPNLLFSSAEQTRHSFQSSIKLEASWGEILLGSFSDLTKVYGVVNNAFTIYYPSNPIIGEFFSMKGYRYEYVNGNAGNIYAAYEFNGNPPSVSNGIYFDAMLIKRQN